jgi:hypothetical protein
MRCVQANRRCPDRIRVRTLRRQVKAGRARIDLGKLKRGVYVISVKAATTASTSTRVR